jgi:hypothetical protein
MNLEITGKLIEKYDVQQVSERFKKREFVLELVEEVNGSPYTNYAKMQLVQNKCDILDRFNVGDMLKVNFNIKGNRYEKEGRTSYFSNLDAWRLEKADMNANNNNSGNAGYNNNGFNSNSNSNSNWGAGNSNNNSTSNSNSNSFQGANSNASFQGNAAESADDLPF